MRTTTASPCPTSEYGHYGLAERRPRLGGEETAGPARSGPATGSRLPRGSSRIMTPALITTRVRSPGTRDREQLEFEPRKKFQYPPERMQGRQGKLQHQVHIDEQQQAAAEDQGNKDETDPGHREQVREQA